jgi:hypothetical protein
MACKARHECGDRVGRHQSGKSRPNDRMCAQDHLKPIVAAAVGRNLSFWREGYCPRECLQMVGISDCLLVST